MAYNFNYFSKNIFMKIFKNNLLKGAIILSVGGMITKIKAAKMTTAKGIDLVIANGDNPSNVYDIVEGKDVGTRFIAKKVD